LNTTKKIKTLLTIFVLTITVCLLTTSFAQAETDVEKEYKEGLYQREKGSLYDSIEAFNSILSAQPNLHRVRLELAVAYYRAMNFADAKRHAKQVLDNPKTPQNVKLSINAFLAQLKKDEEAFFAKKSKLEYSAGFGILHDTNVNAGPSTSTVPVGIYTLYLTPTSVQQSDSAVYASAGVSHMYQSPKTFKAGNKFGRYGWISKINLYNKTYFHEQDYDLDIISLSTGPTFSVMQSWRANLNIGIDLIRIGDRRKGKYYSLTPSFSKQYKNSEITWDAAVIWREFRQKVDADRDSTYMSTGIYYGRLFKDGKFAVQVGGRLFNENADIGRFSNDGTEILAGANWVAWSNGSVYGRFRQKDSRYDGIEPLFAKKRNETEQRYDAGINHTLKKGFLKEWKITASYTYTDNQSNVAIYDYDREVIGLGMSRAFK
jgi:hypothetical protein